MALTFPASPTIGDEFVGGGFTWIWTGVSWDKVSAGGGGGGNTGFYLSVGGSGDTTYSFEDAQPAGVYFITSEQGDTTYDVYAVGSDGSNAGYTSSGKLVANTEFTAVVAYSTQDYDVLKFESKPTVFTTTSGEIAGGAAPFLTSATPLSLEDIDETTTVTGGNFATDVEFYFVDTAGSATAAKAVVRNSTTQAIVTRPDSLSPTVAPFDLRAVNPGVTSPSTGVHELANVISAGTLPVFATSSQLFWEPGVTSSLTIVASDAEGSDVDYSIVSGSLLPNMSLDGESGVITCSDDSGYLAGDSTVVTIAATDAGGNSVNKVFELYAGQYPVYSFYFDPFVNAGALSNMLLYEMNY